MMKRKFLTVVLPIVGCATVVGSGFSAWYFGEAETTGDDGLASVSVTVTDEIKSAKGALKYVPLTDEKGELLTAEGVLVLDQGGANNESLDSGIMFGDGTEKETVENTLSWQFKMSYVGNNNLTIFDIYDAGLWLRFEVSVELKGSLGKYVTFQDLISLDVTPSSASFKDGGAFDSTLSLKTDESNENKNENKIVGNYEIDNDTIKKLQGEGTSLDWTFKLDLSTKAKSSTNEDNSEVERTDYSNALLKYKSNDSTIVEATEPEGEATYKLNGGKPLHTGEPEQMYSDLTSTSSQIDFKVVGYIEDDPTR